MMNGIDYVHAKFFFSFSPEEDIYIGQVPLRQRSLAACLKVEGSGWVGKPNC
jgi:hypothetical protein